VVAVDGTEVNGPTPVADTAVLITAGGRADLEVSMPADGSPVRVHVGGPTGVVLGSRSFHVPSMPRPATTLDRLAYGTKATMGFDPDRPDRSSGTTSAACPAFSTEGPVYFGPSMAISAQMCPCSSSPSVT
jgi:hypothetical protein